ncbi:MAG TPA: ABC transporter permease [candidate division Zixibacteria bacterium]|nr:ABC transporter permease [candidate division Zixibacteria bacterium]
MGKRYRPLRIVSPIAFLGLWEIAVRLADIDQLLIPSPVSVVRTMFDLTIDGRLPWAIGVSLVRVLQGFVYGAALGIVVGLLVGWFRAVEDAVDPLVAAIYPIPKSALFPLFILWFGLGETSKVMTIMIGVLFLVLINTVTGVKSLDPVLLKAARDLGANQRQIFTKVVIPGALPNIFTGLRLGAGMALILVFITEIEATREGLGFLLWESYQLLLVKQVFGCTIAFGILGILSTWSLQWLERACCPWRRV